MRFHDPDLLNMMLTWGFFYFAGFDYEFAGMAGGRLYDWLILATARCQNRKLVY